MRSDRCPECDRLWREHDEVSQKTFRLEARLIRAQSVQDHDLVEALAARLARLMQEQNRTSEAFAQHQAKAHSRKVGPSGD